MLEKLFYLHIPKTGGQTLATRLAAAFPRGRSRIFEPDLVFPSGLDELKRHFDSFDFIESHVTGSVLMDNFGFRVLTSVRDPVEQIISSYLHIRREPRHILHRPAVNLNPQRFFDTYSDFFTNQQSRYLISAFFDCGSNAARLDFLTENLFSALEKIDWIVPTENMEEFLFAWAIENKLMIPGAKVNVNVAPEKALGMQIRDYLRDQSNLYCVDLVFWNAAKDRFNNYKRKIVEDQAGGQCADNDSRAYWDGECGIWLCDGWHTSQPNSEFNNEWWSGPESRSTVRYKVSYKYKFLKFKIIVVNGIKFDQILVKDIDYCDICVSRSFVNNEYLQIEIPISELPENGQFFLEVPDVYSPMMVYSDSTDPIRKAIASADWLLE